MTDLIRPLHSCNWRSWFLAVASFAGLIFQATASESEPSQIKNIPDPVSAQNFLAVTANAHATQAAVDVLSAGGSAVDAAIVAQLVLNLVEPQSSGIGGGAFMLYYHAADNTLYALDGRETAPATAGPEHFLNTDGTPLSWREAVVGGRAVGVPGTLHLLHTAHQRFANRPWRSLFQPAIALAEGGFNVSPRLASAIASASDRGLRRFTPTRQYFFTENGTPLPQGYRLKNPAFATTLRRIADDGIGPFYSGEIGHRIVDTVRSAANSPGLITRLDLESYRTIIRQPVCQAYRGYRVCGMGPPSSGGLTVGQILGLLRHFDLRAAGSGAVGLHLVLEASRLAFADRAKYMADSDFVSVPEAGLLNAGYLRQRAGLIRRDSSMGKAQAGSPPKAVTALSPDNREKLPGTSHISIVDRYGNAVSMTTTIESGFGSRLMTGGFLLNNELTDFSFLPERHGLPVANRVEGRKRPRSSMAPTMVFDHLGQPVIVAGSPGGSRIIGYVVQALIAMLDWGMAPQQAVEMPHFINRNGPTELENEPRNQNLQSALESLGHEVRVRRLNSGLHVIRRNPDGRLEAGVDPRREGLALGG